MPARLRRAGRRNALFLVVPRPRTAEARTLPPGEGKLRRREHAPASRSIRSLPRLGRRVRHRRDRARRRRGRGRRVGRVRGRHAVDRGPDRHEPSSTADSPRASAVARGEEAARRRRGRGHARSSGHRRGRARARRDERGLGRDGARERSRSLEASQPARSIDALNEGRAPVRVRREGRRASCRLRESLRDVAARCARTRSRRRRSAPRSSCRGAPPPRG